MADRLWLHYPAEILRGFLYQGETARKDRKGRLSWSKNSAFPLFKTLPFFVARQHQPRTVGRSP